MTILAMQTLLRPAPISGCVARIRSKTISSAGPVRRISAEGHVEIREIPRQILRLLSATVADIGGTSPTLAKKNPHGI
jgi:hypothetical protein